MSRTIPGAGKQPAEPHSVAHGDGDGDTGVTADVAHPRHPVNPGDEEEIVVRPDLGHPDLSSVDA